MEVRFDGGWVRIRDTKYRRSPGNDPAREPVITVTAHRWETFLDEVTGRIPAGANGALAVEAGASGTTVVCCTGTGTTLTYTPSEWRAFLDGVLAGELRPPQLASV